MAGRQLVAAIVTVLALGSCADDSYESVSKEIDQLMTQGIFLSEGKRILG